jgi:hypothetical protein
MALRVRFEGAVSLASVYEASVRWANVCPKHVQLILEINKTVIVASSWCSIFKEKIINFFVTITERRDFSAGVTYYLC